MELLGWQKFELLNRCKLVLPDAEYAPDESYTKDAVIFEDHCNCYSEYTTEAACLTIFLRATCDAADHWQKMSEMQSAVHAWATGNLTWTGCSCCEERLYADVRFFPRKAN